MPFRVVVLLWRRRGGRRNGSCCVEPPSCLVQGAFGGPGFSSTDLGRGGFPSGNNDPVDVSWHRAEIFQKQPLFWPAQIGWLSNVDFTTYHVICWLCCVFSTRHGTGKPQWRRRMISSKLKHFEAQSIPRTNIYSLSQLHAAWQRWASELGLAVHNQVQEFKCQVEQNFWKAIMIFPPPKHACPPHWPLGKLWF